MSGLEDFNGTERRQDTVAKAMLAWQAHFDEHEKGEWARYDSILDEVKANRNQVEALTKSIATYIETEPDKIVQRIEIMIDEAFPVHPDDPMATPADKRRAHRNAHADWIRRVDAELKRWEGVRQKVLEWGAISIIGLVAIAVLKFVVFKGSQL